MPETSRGKDWQAALEVRMIHEYIANPLPPREELSALEEYQCRIVGGTLVSWLQTHSRPLLREREFLKDIRQLERDPLIVFISDKPGLIAARQILEGAPFPIVYLSQETFDAFIEQDPDETFCWHVVFTSYFHQNADGDTQSAMHATHQLQPGEEFWLHREVSTLAPLFARGGEHLWKWDGEKMSLVEEAFSTWIS